MSLFVCSIRDIVRETGGSDSCVAELYQIWETGSDPKLCYE